MKNILIPNTWYKDIQKFKKVFENDSNIKISNTTFICLVLQELIQWEEVRKEYRWLTEKGDR